MKQKVMRILIACLLISCCLHLNAQSYLIDWFSINNGGTTSAGGTYSLIGATSQPYEMEMSGDGYTMEGSLQSFLGEGSQTSQSITLFDNISGSFNGLQSADATTWLANKFCLGPQTYFLDAVALSLSTRYPDNPPVVHLEIYSDDLAGNKPFASTGLEMKLFGETNPIIFTAVAGTYERLVTWTPSTPFILEANTCYWVVLRLESGEVLTTASFTMPSGAAAAFGRSSSTDAGAIWESADLASNRKMRIMGTAEPTWLDCAISAVTASGNALQFSFPAAFGNSFTIEGRADLVAGEWTEVSDTTITSNGNTSQVTIPNAFALPQQFYRVKKLLQ